MQGRTRQIAGLGFSTKKKKVGGDFRGARLRGQRAGVIKRITQRLNPARSAAVAALPAAERTRGGTQWVLPTLRRASFRPAAKIVLFDRSWYNRAGVERVMGVFAPTTKYEEFFHSVPGNSSGLLVRSGIILFKYWFLDHRRGFSNFRFTMRIQDPL